MKLTMIALILFGLISQNIFCEDSHQADHELLKELLVKLTTALNNQNMDELSGNLSKDFRFTTLDQKIIRTPEELKKYYEDLFKSNNAMIKGYKTTPKIDESAIFVSDTVCYCVGTANDEYKLSNNDEIKLPIRWSTLLEKENGVWKVRLLHLSANFYDNPAVTKIESSMKQLIYIAVAIAFFAGIILQFFLSKMLKK